MFTPLLDMAKDLITNGRFQEAEQYLLRINDPNNLILAEKFYLLGFIKLQQNLLSEAEHYFKEIKKDWDIKFYAQAIYDLGVLKETQEDISVAQSYWESIEYDWSPEIYASAKLNLGALAFDIGNPHLAKKYWLEIKKDWSPDIYIKAQFNLGKLHIDEKDYSNASFFFQKIMPQENEKIYASAVPHLIHIAFYEKKYTDIIKYALSLQYEWDPLVYNVSRQAMLIVSRSCVELFDWEESNKYLQHIDTPELSYEKNCLQLISDHKNKSLLSIYTKVNEIKKALLITQDKSNYYCLNIAHYTSSNTALKILKDTNDKNYSPFRLSSIEFMNDPKEGSIIYEWLGIPSPIGHRTSCAFASCFSFNHDSLNQFRLYGKQDNIETTGVSIVFNLDFFINNQNGSTHIIKGSQKTNSLYKKGDIPQQMVSKYPLYRCIYFDPTTHYFKVAKRSEYSFYKELVNLDTDKLEVQLAEYMLHSSIQSGVFTKNIYDDSIEFKANDSRSVKLHKLYKSYLHSIEAGEKELNTLISELKQTVQKIVKTTPHLTPVLYELLLPLRYLIKHPAFEEEQECRMLAILPLDHEKINSDPENLSFYINYDVPARKYVNKIYLGEGAKSQRIFFEHILSDPEKIKNSSNPFRIK